MRHCSACGKRIRLGEAERCRCGQTVHPSCDHYHREFECAEARGASSPRSHAHDDDGSQDRWIGLQEF